jgi:hypothetical protein
LVEHTTENRGVAGSIPALAIVVDSARTTAPCAYQGAIKGEAIETALHRA